jgi:hypothetical protein
MPTAKEILSWANVVANDWSWLAILWHLGLAAALVWLATARPTRRLIGAFLVLPVLSVAAVAWASGNPFNGLTFTLLAALLLRAVVHLAPISFVPASRGWMLTGSGLVAFGWIYPHFLAAESWTAYAYASPFGLLPCPTLAVVIGITLVCGGLSSAAWSVPLAAAGVLYGLIGVFILGVALDVWLLGGALLLSLMSIAHRGGRVRATAEERVRVLPGDEHLPAATGVLTHAITIGAPAEEVWPWIVQMGAGRAGWYSYDFLDNGRRASATRVVPELQRMEIGTVFPALPGVTEGFIVLAFEPYRSLVLAWPDRVGPPTVTWAFVLEQCRDNATRLIVRARAGRGYRFHGLPAWISDPAIRLVHFVMERKQLVGIAERVRAH